jgi:hypothetical protein
MARFIWFPGSYRGARRCWRQHTQHLMRPNGRRPDHRLNRCRAGVFGRNSVGAKRTINPMAEKPDNVVQFPDPGWTPPILTRVGGIHTPDGQPGEVWVDDNIGGIVVFVWPSDKAAADMPDNINPFAWALNPEEARDLAGLLLHAAGRLADRTTPEVRGTYFPPRPNPGKYPTNPA